MKGLLVVALAFALAGCGGGGSRVVIVSSGDRLDWASHVGPADSVPDSALVKRVKEAAAASGARVLDVAVLAVGGQLAPAVTLQRSDPAAYMKHHLRGFLQRIGYRSIRVPSSTSAARSSTRSWSATSRRRARQADH